MKHLITICLLLTIVSSSKSFSQQRYYRTGSGESWEDREARHKAMIGKKFPDFKAKNGDSVLTDKKLEGKVVFVNFWFAACKPCIAEFKGLNEMYDKLKDSTGFQFVSFTYEDKRMINEFRKKYDLKFPIYSIKLSECQRLNGDNSYPANLILGKDLRITHFKVGGSTNEEHATQMIMQNYYVPIIKQLEF